MKKTELKTLIRAILKEVRHQSIKSEHRGERGSLVGKVRSKNHEQGKLGLLAPRKSSGGEGGNEGQYVKWYLNKTKSSDRLLDLATTLGLKVPNNISRFDSAEIASFILGNLYPQDAQTGNFSTNTDMVNKAYDTLMAQGFIREVSKKPAMEYPSVDKTFNNGELNKDGTNKCNMNENKKQKK